MCIIFTERMIWTWACIQITRASQKCGILTWLVRAADRQSHRHNPDRMSPAPVRTCAAAADDCCECGPWFPVGFSERQLADRNRLGHAADLVRPVPGYGLITVSLFYFYFCKIFLIINIYKQGRYLIQCSLRSESITLFPLPHVIINCNMSIVYNSQWIPFPTTST